MQSPYIDTKLTTTVTLKPHQLDNKIYINLKKNLENKVLNICYKKYGYIVDIHQILKYENGVMPPESFDASVKFNIEFACRLCRPLIDTMIICKINRINKVLTTAANGPILAIITNDRINDSVFFSDRNNKLRYKKQETPHGQELKHNDFVIIKIMSVVINHGDSKIVSIGFLENIASDDDIEKFYKDQYEHKE